jgi:hypothetical protein
VDKRILGIAYDRDPFNFHFVGEDGTDLLNGDRYIGFFQNPVCLSGDEPAGYVQYKKQQDKKTDDRNQDDPYGSSESFQSCYFR